MSANFQVELHGQWPGCLWHLEKVGKLPCCLFMCFGGKLFNFSKELMAVRGISLCITSLTFVRTSVWPEILLIFNFFEYFISEYYFFLRFLYMNTVFLSTSLSSSNQLLSVVSLPLSFSNSWPLLELPDFQKSIALSVHKTHKSFHNVEIVMLLERALRKRRVPLTLKLGNSVFLVS